MNSSDGTTRWGVLGCSAIAAGYLIPAIRAAGGTVEAIASRDRERARAVAGELDIPRAYGSYPELLADERLDVVYIALPNALHAEWVAAALKAGRHVLVEKPLTRDGDTARELTELAERESAVLMEGYMYRHHPQWATLAGLPALHARSDGPVLLRSHLGYRLTDTTNIRMDPTLGGGAFLDIGCYAVSAATQLFGVAESASARVIHTHADTGVDTLVAAHLVFPGGHVAVIDCDLLFDWTTTPLELRTPSATIVLEHAYNPGNAPTEIVVDRQGVDRERHGHAGADAYRAMVTNFCRLLREGSGSDGAERERTLIRSVARNLQMLWESAVMQGIPAGGSRRGGTADAG